MVSADALLFSYRWGAETLQKLTADIADDKFAEQPIPGINHPAWLVGHVSLYNDVIAALLRGQAFDNPWDAPCGKNSQPLADRAAYGSKTAILDQFQSGYEDAAAVMAEAHAAAWEAPLAHPTWGKQFATVAPAVVYLATTHLGLHVGQLSGWRRAAGMPRV
ncbi:DinB family protein [Botrimarina hoheduenensis]|uniref:DinB superfamily protein n=1 Tax=Botrimarina hoheduenensis TaxID=2528000 RepID=A0A5C5VTH5_9BACT|nr:DinB family protein [Botrimarina hoheduenensis]TWT41437.1 DinB superfamily protein [Botrimarina hoheduenensis]